MKTAKIACFDVYYYERYAKACCIVFEAKPTEKIFSCYTETISAVEDYISGQFYKRELPCLLKVYKGVKEDIDLIIIDSFVMLGNGAKGLGAYLYEALGKRIPIIGVAKTLFKGCDSYRKIYRGQSRNPLYISSVGIGLNESAQLIKELKGDNRIPDVLKKVDQMTRSENCLKDSK